jgi:hypothetical protein
MTIATANVANTNTFYYWQTVTNQLAGAMSTAVITTTANGSTAQTAGNAAIGGTMFANVHLANLVTANSILLVGNATVNVVSNSTTIKISNSTATFTLANPTSAQASGGSYYLNANGSWALVTQSTTQVGNTTTTGTKTQTVYEWAMTAFRSAEYQFNVKDNNANNYMMTKLIIMHDTANSYATEWGSMISNGNMGVFTHNVTGANVRIQFTPVSTSTEVRYIRTAV